MPWLEIKKKPKVCRCRKHKPWIWWARLTKRAHKGSVWICPRCKDHWTMWRESPGWSKPEEWKWI